MNLRHLRIFLTVCEAGSMTRAAEIVYMAQPSVSQVIAELENEYGVRLFERLNHKLYLTAAGEHLRTYANHIVNLSEQVQKELKDLAAYGSIRVGASLTIGAHLLPGIIDAYRKELPQVEIFTQVDNTSVIEKMLMDDRIDLGLVEGPVYSPHIQEETLCEDNLVIICGPGHPFWNEGAIELGQLSGKSFIIREQGSGTRDIFERVMSSVDTAWKIIGVYNNTEAIKQAVRENLGLAVVSKISVKEEVERGLMRIVEVNGLNLKRNLNLVYHRQKFFTAAMQTFTQIAKTISAKHLK